MSRQVRHGGERHRSHRNNTLNRWDNIKWLCQLTPLSMWESQGHGKTDACMHLWTSGCQEVNAFIDLTNCNTIFSAVIPQKQQCLLRELVVLEVLTVGRLFHSNNTVPFTLLYLQEVSELHWFHLTDFRQDVNKDPKILKELFRVTFTPVIYIKYRRS